MKPTTEPARFNGYVRADGRVGTRNYLGVLIVGNCAATAARKVAAAFTPKRLAAFPNVDGVVPFVHELGCGMEKSGEPMDLLRRALGGSIRNPNLAGAVVMALGCDRNNIYAFLEQEGLQTGTMLKSVVLQEVGGTANAIAEGVAAIEAMLPEANRVSRQPAPVSELVVGLLAEPMNADDAAVCAALGAAVDRLVQEGGTAIVSDTSRSGPVLAARAASPAIARAAEQRVVWWKDYTAGRDTRLAHPQTVDETTDALPHSGTTPLQAVFGYAHALPAKGLLLMDSPGYEAVAATGQIASGATLVCVASRGASSFGAAAAPTVKVALDAAQYRRFEDDLDVDASGVASGAVSVQDMGERIFQRWIAHASGEPTCNEELGVGENEFVPWPVGVFA